MSRKNICHFGTHGSYCRDKCRVKSLAALWQGVIFGTACPGIDKFLLHFKTVLEISVYEIACRIASRIAGILYLRKVFL